jgi:type VI secretion system protein ImpB
MGDFVGKPEEPLPALKNRKFVEIDPDNFNQVLAGMKPRVAFTVDNKLQEDGSKVGVDLTFTNIEDFEPDRIVQNVEPLRKLVEARQKLSDLRSKMDGNEKLENLLESVISDAAKQKELSDSLGLEAKKEE